MEGRSRMLKEMMSAKSHPSYGHYALPHPYDHGVKKVPYLVSPTKTPEEYTEEEANWLREREEKRRGYLPSGWWNYYLDCVEVKIRDGDSLGLWITRSTALPPTPLQSDEVPFVLLLHGGGFSGLTWGPMVDELSYLIEAEYGALDLRGHGESLCKDESNLSLEVLTEDVMDALRWMQSDESLRLSKRPLIIVGHSMGGALAVNVSTLLQEADQIKLAGLVVLDVVEGSALMALTSMQFFLKGRPQEFTSLPEAIHWCTRSGQTKNLDSARASMSGQLVSKATGQLATLFVSKDGSIDPSITLNKKRIWCHDEKTTTELGNDLSPMPPFAGFKWRIDLSNTEPYWKGWFEGLSKKFLSLRCPKLLMLAGVDRLDKELTVGQMQGKFQMQVFHQVGHSIHEDAPDKAAGCIASFLARQRLVTSKGPIPAALPGC